MTNVQYNANSGPKGRFKMSKFNGLRKHKRYDILTPGYSDQAEYASPVKVLTKEEIQALYPGAKVNLRPETAEEAWARIKKNARMRSSALRKRSNFTWE